MKFTQMMVFPEWIVHNSEIFLIPDLHTRVAMSTVCELEAMAQSK
jgi:hypothetical protein